MNGQRRGALLIMSAAFLWGTLGVFAKTIYAVTPVDPISLSLLRILFAIPVFGLLVGLKRYRLTMTLREVVLFVGFGFFGVAVYVSLYFSSIAYTTVQHAVALLYTAPAFVAVFSWFILKEQLTRSKIIAVLLSILGAFLILGIVRGEPLFASRTQIGDWMAIGAGLAYSTWYIFGKMLGENREAAVTSFVGLSIGALLLLPLVFMLGGLHLPENWMGWSLVAAVGFVSSLAFLLYFAGLRLIEATKASIFAIIEPLTAAILAFIFLRETLSYDSLLGFALIVGSVLLVSISKGPLAT